MSGCDRFALAFIIVGSDGLIVHQLAIPGQHLLTRGELDVDTDGRCDAAPYRRQQLGFRCGRHGVRPALPVVVEVLRDQLLQLNSHLCALLRSRDSLEQIAIVLSGLVTLALIVAAAMLALAPWGVESNDMLANFRAAFFGFKVGDVTVSLSSIIIAIIVFALGWAAARASASRPV